MKSKATVFVPKTSQKSYTAAAGDVWITAESTEVMLRVVSEVAHSLPAARFCLTSTAAKEGAAACLCRHVSTTSNSFCPWCAIGCHMCGLSSPRPLYAALVERLCTTLRQWHEDVGYELASATTAGAT